MTENESAILREYDSIEQDLRDWGNFIDKTLMLEVLTGLYEGGLIKIPPKYRLKDRRSYLLKALYRKRGFTNPIVEIEDKIATRLVVLKSEDVREASDLITSSNKWKSRITKNVKEEIEDQPKIFDYQSSHIVVYANDSYTTGRDKRVLTCEIQIRTLLQHAFAEISHDSTYKGPYRNDTDILRQLAKSMALMEATDDYFCKIFHIMSDVKRKYDVILKELTSILRQFTSRFIPIEVDFDLSYKILELDILKPLIINEIEAFVQSNKVELSRAIRPKNGFIFTQPIILVIAFYLFKHQRFLRENWPFDSNSLKSIFLVFNFSYNEY